MIVPIKSRFIQLSEEAFFLFCQEMDHFHIECDSDGTILITEPIDSESGSFDLEVGSELRNWNKKSNNGKTFGSSAGFTLPDQSVRSPDAAWIAIERWKRLSLEDRKRFAHISPDFVIEIRSETDQLDRLKEKMASYIQNGVKLGWLIDPQQQEVWIYRANGTVEQIGSFDIPLSGEDVLAGFELRLSTLWDPEA